MKQNVPSLTHGLTPSIKIKLKLGGFLHQDLYTNNLIYINLCEWGVHPLGFSSVISIVYNNNQIKALTRIL